MPLARELGPEQPFYAFQSRGLHGDEEPFTRIEQMAAHYLTLLREVQPQGPYQLSGWSFGGLVAYEMARQLAAGNQDVAFLALVDVAAPSDRSESPDEAIFADDAFWLADVAAFLARLAGREPAISQDELSRVAVRASWSYQPLPYSGRMTLLRAASGPGPSADPTGASGAGAGDPALGWGRLCSLPVAVHTVSGTHLTVLAPANVEALAERLRSCLESVRSQLR